MKTLEHKTGLIFDLCFCIVIMPLLMVLGRIQYWWTVSPLFTCLAVSYFYGCYFVAKSLRLPQLVLSRSYLRIAWIAAAFIALTYILTLYPLPEMDFVIPSMSEYQTLVRNHNITMTVWFISSVVLCYSLTAAFIKELYQRLLLQKTVENQRDKAELALFKAQINPHFLFNTLNSLYSLVVGTSRKAEEAFIKFTELLKYTYTAAGNDWVSIADEVIYIDNYIDLQMLRLDGHTDVVWEKSVDDCCVRIPPMIFLTFVENAFKYGTSTSKDCKILIRLHLEDGMLLFETGNRLVRHSDEFRKDVPVGISNCRNRLTVLFPDSHSLDIKEDDGTFRVLLKINLNKNGKHNKMRGN